MGARLQVYETEGITVTFDPRLCIHAAECVRSLPKVFDPSRRRWIQPEHASPDEVAAAVARCPTGALQARRPGEAAAAAAAAAAVTITPSTDGPLLVRGPVRVLTPAGEVLREDDRVALCRCGATGTPPFCDGSHARVGFHPAV